MRTTLLLGLVVLTGCQKAAQRPAVAEAATPSGRGWEVRYNAALSAARRGGDAAADPVILDTLAEMLDESQQLRNFRTTLRDGREVPDEQSAREAVIGTLRAVAELHRKRPTLDLAPLKPAIAKLTESGNVVVRTEAKATQLALQTQ